jgi:hypothetical protein
MPSGPLVSSQLRSYDVGQRAKAGRAFDPNPTLSLPGSVKVTLLSLRIDTHRQDNITIVDIRVERLFRLGRGRTISGFVDGYNLLNSNAATNINWSSGATYLTRSTIVAPCIASIGMKFD